MRTVTYFVISALLLCCNPETKNLSRPVMPAYATATDSCAYQHALARYDAQMHQLKYYHYGFAMPSKTYLEAMHKKGVEVVSLGCVVNELQICYNHTADSIMNAR